MTIPALFLSHGAPTLGVQRTPETDAWAALAQELPRPREILVISAHWDTDEPVVSTAPQPATIHDFYGFPRELYQQHYSAPGAPALGERVAKLLGGASIPCSIDRERGLDHGAWVPLKWMYPAAALQPSAKRGSDACPSVGDSESDRAAWAPRSASRASRIFGTRIPILDYYGGAAGLHDFGQGVAVFFAARAAASRGANGMAAPAAASRRGATGALVSPLADGAACLLLSVELIFTRSLVAR